MILAGDDLGDYRKVYAEATKWCQDQYLAYQARRSRRLAYADIRTTQKHYLQVQPELIDAARRAVEEVLK